MPAGTGRVSSHRLIHHVRVDSQATAEPERVEAAMQRLPLVYLDTGTRFGGVLALQPVTSVGSEPQQPAAMDADLLLQRGPQQALS